MGNDLRADEPDGLQRFGLILDGAAKENMRHAKALHIFQVANAVLRPAYDQRLLHRFRVKASIASAEQILRLMAGAFRRPRQMHITAQNEVVHLLCTAMLL